MTVTTSIEMLMSLWILLLPSLLLVVTDHNRQTLIGNPMLELRDKWKNHVEGIRSDLLLIHEVAIVIAICRQLIDCEPRAVLNFVACARRKFRIGWDILDDVETRVLIIAGLPFNKVILVN